MFRFPVTAAMAAIIAGFMLLVDVQGASAAEDTVKIPTGAKVEIRGNTAIISNGNGVIKGTYNCACTTTGNCITQQTGGALWCGATDNNACKGSCKLTSTTGLSAAPIAPPKSKSQ